MRDFLICVDDTDNLESRGTGSIASEMAGIIESKGWGRCGFISRHQLVLHEAVRYTSHNSSMCFNAEIDESRLTEITESLSAYLESESAEGSDPGLCIADVKQLAESKLLRRKLIEFGYRAKTEVLTKTEAYELAAEAGVFLNELGGTGDGIIGALAGVGLRFHGFDGEVKGGIEHLAAGGTYTAEELKNERMISAVRTTVLEAVPDDTPVTISWKAKPVLHDGRPVLLIRKDGEQWFTLHKNEMRSFGDERAVKPACGMYKPDVPEELVNSDARSCYNCTYRRWIENSFECAKKVFDTGNQIY